MKLSFRLFEAVDFREAKVGTPVQCVVHGKGTITHRHGGSPYGCGFPIEVEFERSINNQRYTSGGHLHLKSTLLAYSESAMLYFGGFGVLPTAENLKHVEPLNFDI
jgi:hypothetical protein